VVILFAFFLRGIFLVNVFPIFVGQDESRHYNTTQFLANSQVLDCRSENISQVKSDLSTYRYSEEIRELARVAQNSQTRGSYYDKVIFNKGLDGLGEVDFKSKKHSFKQESCPPDLAVNFLGWGGFSLYHWLAGGVEKFLSGKNLFVRYDFLRIFSVFLGVITLVLAYYIFKTVSFSTKESLLLTAIISFQPKLSIYFTNINYDVLLMPLWTGFIFLGLLILKNGWTLFRGVVIFLLFCLAVMTKATAFSLLGLLLFLLGKTIYFKFKTHFSGKRFFGIILLVAVFLIVLLYWFLGKLGLLAMFELKMFGSLGEYLSKSLPKIYGSSRDYWGVTSWSQNNLTLWYVRIIWLVELLAGMGLIFSFVGHRFFPGWQKKNVFNVKYFWFVFLALFSLQFGIRVADWKIFSLTGKLNLGTPGRYWFPNIIPHFILVGWGLKSLVNFIWREELRRGYFALILSLFLVLMICYWFYEVWDIIIPRYYL